MALLCLIAGKPAILRGFVRKGLGMAAVADSNQDKNLVHGRVVAGKDWRSAHDSGWTVGAHEGFDSDHEG